MAATQSPPSRSAPLPDEPLLEHLVVCVTQVVGATAAIVTHGDAATLTVAQAANIEIRNAVSAVGGRVIKSLGEGLLITFPADRARDAVAAMRSASERASTRWHAFDSRCELQVKMTLGPVLAGSLGLTGDPSPDVWGLTVHKLFKERAHGFSILPELATALGDSSPAV